MKNLLVTGISGFLGWHIARMPQTDWDITGTYHQNKVSIPSGKTLLLDLTDEAALASVLRKVKPSAVLHLAAASDPNFCEENPQISQAVNVEATVHLAEYAARKKIPFLFTSSDLVFDGQKGQYKETDQPSPVNRYGLHKAVAESKVAEINPKAIIARLSLMYGLTDRTDNFLSGWLEKAKAGEAFQAFNDEFRSPASGTDIARGLLLLLDNKAKGIWHLGGMERISRYEFALKMATAFDFSPGLIEETKQDEINMPATRPPDVSLNIEKATSFGYQPESVEENLKFLAS